MKNLEKSGISIMLLAIFSNTITVALDPGLFRAVLQVSGFLVLLVGFVFFRYGPDIFDE